MSCEAEKKGKGMRGLKAVVVVSAGIAARVAFGAVETFPLPPKATAVVTNAAAVVRDIPYAPENGKFGLGDLYLPQSVSDETPVVLAIHGGGWSAGDRYSWSGVAEFFCRDLGCAVFNIEYRLASATNRWPACGDDCVKAANWLFTDAFREYAGFATKKIYICGGSAGGHLTLWTLVNLPPEKVSGAVSISSIGDPAIDCVPHRGRYTTLFGVKDVEGRLAEMNPILKVKSGMAPVLCTHVTEDKVVPIASHKAFADAYRAAGNMCDFFEYPETIRPGLKWHCTWIPDSNPHRLIPELEAQIKAFMERCEKPRLSKREAMWTDFVNPPDSAKPWAYYLWQNGHADKETITADLEAMKRLGFGGINMLDTRGYWDDENHVVIPKAELVWGSPEWYDLVEFCIRECARVGLEFTMNCAASGGSLTRFIDGKEHECDVTSREAVMEHLDAVLGPILKRVPEHVGKTFTHIYSVSYEGNVKKGFTWRTIKDTFYATMREWAHSHGLKVYSESGGPWYMGGAATKLDCSQLDMLAHNDFPQGEFWPNKERDEIFDAGHANRNARYFQRGVVLSARREGRRIVSMEAFTHMLRHYSVDPAFLKPLADMTFADGANLMVWHTFTSSPKKFGVPGNEYFAGSHINRNVTWHKDADAFVKYLGRCQSLLQRGEYVDDGEFVDVATNYYGWGRFRKDVEAQFTTIHRREGDFDWFFVAGEGKGVLELNAPCEGRTVEIWDAVTAARKCATFRPLGVSRTFVDLDLPVGGSCFVVFMPKSSQKGSKNSTLQLQLKTPTRIPVTNAWHVSFAYHDGISAAPPAPIVMETLRDWTTCGADGDAASTSLRYFSGTATYRTTLQLPHSLALSLSHSITPSLPHSHTLTLSLGNVPTGLAHVFVNGVDCGVVWCAPWEADISSAIREGENEIEIRYTNNWYNRLVGDCFLKPEGRVTRSSLRYWTKPRAYSDPNRPWMLLPTVYSGPSVSDWLQPSGLGGPISIKVREKASELKRLLDELAIDEHLE